MFGFLGSSQLRLGLSLSGGGFRATLFHLGVIRLLHDAKRLRDVKRVGAVSGGSVLAAHLTLNWERYNGSDADFEAAAGELIAFVRSDVRGWVVRRWLLACLTVVPRLWLFVVPRIPWKRMPHSWRRQHWTFTNLLQRAYERLYKNATLGDLRASKTPPATEPTDAQAAERPQVFFYTSSLSTGAACAFGRRGFIRGDVREEDGIPAPKTRVAFAVAASSAFPPLFPPIAVNNDVLSSDLAESHFLTDGGVYDNLGIENLLSYHSKDDAGITHYLVSDAGGTFSAIADKKFTFVVSRNVRASDLMMQRVTDLAYARLKAQYGLEFTQIRLADSVPDRSDQGEPSPEAQHLLAHVRTDLDAFSPIEVSYLIHHGYAVARKALFDRGLLDDETLRMSWNALRPVTSSDHDREVLQKSRYRRWGLFSFRDRASWAALAFLLMLLAPMVAFLWLGRVAAENAQRNETRLNIVTDGFLRQLGHAGIVGADDRRRVRDVDALPAAATKMLVVQRAGLEPQFGSGFFVSRDALVTAAHLLFPDPTGDGGRPTAVMIQNEATETLAIAGFRRVRLSAADGPDDLAVALLQPASSGPSRWLSLEASTNLEPSASVSTVGYPTDYQGTAAESFGILLAIRNPIGYYDMDTSPGMSGGPIILNTRPQEAVGVHMGTFGFGKHGVLFGHETVKALQDAIDALRRAQ